LTLLGVVYLQALTFVGDKGVAKDQPEEVSRMDSQSKKGRKPRRKKAWQRGASQGGATNPNGVCTPSEMDTARQEVRRDEFQELVEDVQEEMRQAHPLNEHGAVRIKMHRGLQHAMYPSRGPGLHWRRFKQAFWNSGWVVIPENYRDSWSADATHLLIFPRDTPDPGGGYRPSDY
jgi:hypothetical protein